MINVQIFEFQICMIVFCVVFRKEVRVNSTNAGGWSALMYASYMGHNSTVQHLIEGGADPNLKNPQGYSSLILASLCGNENTMGALIQVPGKLL